MYETHYVPDKAERERREAEEQGVSRWWTPDVQGPLSDGYYWWRQEGGRPVHLREIYDRYEIVGRLGYAPVWERGEWFGPFGPDDCEELVERRIKERDFDD